MKMQRNAAAILLAAGKGTRMKSELPKVATLLQGKPLLTHVLENVEKAGFKDKIVVVGYSKETVINIAKYKAGVRFAEQTEQLGTGHAVLSAKDALESDTDLVLVACGDAPLISGESFQKLLQHHIDKGYQSTVLTAIFENPFGYGRIIRSSDDGTLLRIVEEKDASPEEKSVKEINTGTYIFNKDLLFEALASVGNDNSQKEYYLTDVIKIFRASHKKVGALALSNPLESHGINSPDDLAKAEEYLAKGLVTV